jgi:hypothetical protein
MLDLYGLLTVWLSSAAEEGRREVKVAYVTGALLDWLSLYAPEMCEDLKRRVASVDSHAQSVLRQPCDGVVELRETDEGRELRCRGVDAGPRSWTPVSLR